MSLRMVVIICDISFSFSFVATCLFVVVGCGGREATGMGRSMVKMEMRTTCVLLCCVAFVTLSYVVT